MNARIASAVMAIVATLDGAAVWAQQPPVTLSPAALNEIAQVEAESIASKHKLWSGLRHRPTMRCSKSSCLAKLCSMTSSSQ